MVGGVPWKKSEDDPEVDGEGMDCRELTAEEKEVLGKAAAWKDAVPRGFSIRKQDVRDHRATKGCPGCDAMLQGKSKQMHSEKCRKRFKELLKDEERVKSAKERMDDFISKMVKERCEGHKRDREEGEESKPEETKRRGGGGGGKSAEKKGRKQRGGL